MNCGVKLAAFLFQNGILVRGSRSNIIRIGVRWVIEGFQAYVARPALSSHSTRGFIYWNNSFLEYVSYPAKDVNDSSYMNTLRKLVLARLSITPSLRGGWRQLTEQTEYQPSMNLQE